MLNGLGKIASFILTGVLVIAAIPFVISSIITGKVNKNKKEEEKEAK
jgi:hypothetical protein